MAQRDREVALDDKESTATPENQSDIEAARKSEERSAPGNSNSQHDSGSNRPVDKPKNHSLVIRFLKLVASQWFIIGMGIAILIASQVQVPSQHQEIKATVVTYLCVSIIFFLTGCTLKTRVLLENASKWHVHIFVQAQCYLLTSAVLFAFVSLCAINKEFMDPGLLLGLILAGCTATTISSNVVMTGRANGNQALTVIESTLGNFLGPFLTPALFTMYISGRPWYTEVLPEEKGGYGEVYRRVFKQLGLSLFLPMVSYPSME